MLVVCRLVLIAVLALAGAAHAASAELWQRAAQAEADADLERAAMLWLEVLGQADLDEHARVAATFRLGVVELRRGHDRDARAHFAYVVEEAPGFALPDDTPAAARALFDEVRRVAAARSAMKAAPAATTSPGGARPLVTPARMLWIGSAAALGVGSVALATGVWFSVQASTYEEQAADARTLDDRVRLDALSDDDIVIADVALLTGAALIVGGSGAAYAAWSIEE